MVAASPSLDDVYRVRVLTQSFGERSGERAVVFGHEETHDSPLASNNDAASMK